MVGTEYAITYLSGELLCLGLIVVMALQMNGNIGAVNEVKLFHRLSLCSIVQIVSECVWILAWSLIPWMPRELMYLSCLGDLLCTGYIVCFWYRFVDIKVTPRQVLEKRSPISETIRLVPIAVLTALDVSSLWNHGVFYLDEANAYVRGSLYAVHSGMCFAYYGAVLLLLLKSQRVHQISKAEQRLFVVFSSLLVIGGILQVLIGFAPFSMLFFTLGMFLIFSGMQSRQIDTDALTKLNNHGRGIALVSARLANAQKEPFYLFMTDIDGFKQINDSYGHIQGDEALLLMADVLRHLVASCHTAFLARFGGDEFIFGIAKEEADPQVVIQKLAQQLSETLDTADLPFRFTVSAGYALADQENIRTEELIAEADKRLYIQKRERHDAGKHPVAVEPGRKILPMQIPSDKGIPKKYTGAPKAQNAAQRALSAGELEKYVVGHLDEALANGWIVPHFQMVVRTITGRQTGAEALARWKDPTYGMIMPSVFVPALEKAGLIYKVDCFIYTKICQIQSRRLAAGLAVQPISVNFSRQDFDKLDMVAFVTDETERYGVSRDLVALEITESVLVQNKETMMSVVRQLQKAGFEVWMDDFGSGYSSLIFLNDYMLDVIKLDMGFLRSFSKASQEIMKSTIDMAKRLGIRTLAEGVETEEHVQFLEEIGCDMMQGYYFSKPLSEADMEKYLMQMKKPAETIAWKSFYDRADSCVVDSDMPRAVMEYDAARDRIRYLFLNSREKEQLRGLGRSSEEESAFALNNQKNPMNTRLRMYLKQAVKTGEKVTSYIVDNSFVLRFSLKLVAAQDDRDIFLVSMVNVTNDRQQEVGKSVNRSISDIVLLFDDVHILNLQQNTVESLVNNFGIEQGYAQGDDLRQGLEYFMIHMIYPDDQERYWQFANPDTMQERLQSTPDGILRAFFRVLLPNDNRQYVYMWKEFNLLAVPGDENGQVLSCIKSIEPSSADSAFEELVKQVSLSAAAASGV